MVFVQQNRPAGRPLSVRQTPLDIDWDLIKVFLGVHRAQTFAGAAERLRIDESTVRRRLGQLEGIVGAPLFTRIDGRLQPVEIGQELLKYALQVETNSSRFLDSALSGLGGGSVRVSMLEMFAVTFGREIAAFRHENPEIDLTVTTEPHLVELSRDGVDIAIRMARPIRGTHKLRSLGRVGFGIYASRAYLDAFDASGSDCHDIIALSAHFAHADHEFILAEEHWLQDLKKKGNVAIQTDCYPVMMELCAANCGIATLPHFLARTNPDLVLIAGDHTRFEIDVWVVIRQEVSESLKVRKVLAFFTDRFGQWLKDMQDPEEPRPEA